MNRHARILSDGQLRVVLHESSDAETLPHEDVSYPERSSGAVEENVSTEIVLSLGEEESLSLRLDEDYSPTSTVSLDPRLLAVAINTRNKHVALEVDRDRTARRRRKRRDTADDANLLESSDESDHGRVNIYPTNVQQHLILAGGQFHNITPPSSDFHGDSDIDLHVQVCSIPSKTLL